jgi:hypothetical protein
LKLPWKAGVKFSDRIQIDVGVRVRGWEGSGHPHRDGPRADDFVNQERREFAIGTEYREIRGSDLIDRGPIRNVFKDLLTTFDRLVEQFRSSIWRFVLMK